MNIKKWVNDYRTIKIIELKKEFTEEEKRLLNKLGILIEDKIYSEYEFDVLSLKLSCFYEDDQMDEEEKKFFENLENTGVTKEQYKKLKQKFDNINEKYSSKFPKVTNQSY